MNQVLRQYFKYFTFLLFLGLLFSCSTYKPFQKNNIKAVYVLYTDTSHYHRYGYRLDNDSIVRWDKQLIGITHALVNNLYRYNTLKKQNSDQLAIFLNKDHWRYVPIKVIGLREFGYIQLENNEVIYYGIMGSVLIDLKYRRVYGEK